MNDVVDQRGLKGFLNKGGFWRLMIIVVVYVALYLGAGKLLALVPGDWGRGDLLSSVTTVFAQLTFALLVGAVILAVFTAWMGWNTELYGRQQIYRSWWMWAGPVIALMPITFRALGYDWGSRALSITMLVMASGFLIGFVEELLCRGIAVKMLRTAGHGEFVVAALSSLVFASLHTLNLFSGQSLRTTAIQVFYTFGFGVLMYLTLRTTRFLLVAMIIHGLTDPTAVLANSGISDSADVSHLNTLLTIGGQFTIPIGLFGLILLLFVRGKYGQTTKGKNASGSHDADATATV